MPEYFANQKFVDFIREVAKQWPRVMDACNRILGMTGPGVHNTPAGITIYERQRKQRQSSQQSASLAIRVRVTGNRTCGGVYAILVITTATGSFNSGASTFADSDVASDTSEEGTLINLNERGETSHLITESPQTMHHVWAYRTGRVDEAGRVVYEANIVDLDDC